MEKTECLMKKDLFTTSFWSQRKRQHSVQDKRKEIGQLLNNYAMTENQQNNAKNEFNLSPAMNFRVWAIILSLQPLKVIIVRMQYNHDSMWEVNTKCGPGQRQVANME